MWHLRFSRYNPAVDDPLEQSWPGMNPSLRIAIAEDDRSIRELLRQMVEGLGHTVVAVADNGRSLVDQCDAARPDVVITDNLMPEMSGLDAALEIYQARQTPVVLLSGHCDPDLVRNAEQMHVLVYLVKPLNKTHLQAALMRCLEQLSVARQNEMEHGEVRLQSPDSPVTDSRRGIAIRRNG
jgi:DNA-binding NtrC family response regulator